MVDQIVLTAWDGALLAALEKKEQLKQAIANLNAKGIPIIAFTSCSRAEIEPIRAQLNWNDPFITESGSGIFTPVNHNPFEPPLGERDGDYFVQDLGCPYVQARAGLRVLANMISHPLKGFGDFTVPKLERFLDISEEAAHRAKDREFSEPFMTPKAVEAEALVKAAKEIGFKVVLRSAAESRFSELVGPGAGLGAAVRQVVAAYQDQLEEGVVLKVRGVCDRDEDLGVLAEASGSANWKGAVMPIDFVSATAWIETVAPLME